MRVKSFPNRINARDSNDDENRAPESTEYYKSKPGTEIALEIDGMQLKCTKEELMEFSGYFNAMFSHQFTESSQRVIELQDNKFNVFYHLIHLSRDRTHKIPESELVMVLKNAFIFQFDNILDDLIHLVKEGLTVENCFLVLKEDLPMDDIYMSVKFKALLSFSESRTSKYLPNLSLRQICEFLGSVYLKCSNEFDVFETAMQWFDKNASKDGDETRVLIKLLSCLDYNSLSVNEIKKMMSCELLTNCRVAQELLKCIVFLKTNEDVEDCKLDKPILNQAEKLVKHSKSRRSATSLCIILDYVYDHNIQKKMKKGNETSNAKTPSYRVTDTKVALYYEEDTGNAHPIVTIGPEYLSTGSETGYAISYKDSLLFLGLEESQIDYDRYNYSSYSTEKHSWSKLLVLPQCRKEYFTAMISGDILYLAGGIGNFRIVQDNINSCNIKTGDWYEPVKLPYRGRELVCCDYLGSLFIINIVDKAGYFFNTTFHTTHGIIDKDDILANFRQLFAVCEYKKDIYLIGNKSIIRMEFDQQQFHIMESIPIENPVSDYDAVEVVICNDNIFCLYKLRVSIFDDRKITLAKFNLVTREFTKIFDDISEGQYIELSGESYRLTLYSRIVPLEYYRILEKEEFIVDQQFSY